VVVNGGDYKIPMQNLARLHHVIREDVFADLDVLLQNSRFVGGEFVRRFEDAFAQYLGVQHVVGVGNGTDALEIILKALGIGPGDGVIVPDVSFVATAEAVVNMGGTPIFAATNANDYLLDGAGLNQALDLAKNEGLQVKAVVAVHLYGKPCDLPELRAISDEHRIFLIEDCAQAHGAAHYDLATKSYKKVGTWGHAAAFSFYPGKNLGAWGDGGAISTDSEELARQCRLNANHGRFSKYDHIAVGRNSRLDALQAIVLTKKLIYLDEWNERRRHIAATYREALRDIRGLEILAPGDSDVVQHVYHQFVVRLTSCSLRDELQKYLAEHGIETSVHYPMAVSAYSAYNGFLKASGAKTGELPILSLPMDPLMGGADIKTVLDSVVQSII
jgi:dTDP-4-amino-4,6-dideoxygalactose transaminase